MKERDATETAFRNGYQAGYKAGRRSCGREWIPVAEGLPQTGKVLCTLMRNGAVQVRGYYAEEVRRFAAEDNITHWMPLPEPPKEEEQ